MPLSENEQRILRQIEQQLERDPAFSTRWLPNAPPPPRAALPSGRRRRGGHRAVPRRERLAGTRRLWPRRSPPPSPSSVRCACSPARRSAYCRSAPGWVVRVVAARPSSPTTTADDLEWKGGAFPLGWSEPALRPARRVRQASLARGECADQGRTSFLRRWNAEAGGGSGRGGLPFLRGSHADGRGAGGPTTSFPTRSRSTSTTASRRARTWRMSGVSSTNCSERAPLTRSWISRRAGR